MCVLILARIRQVSESRVVLERGCAHLLNGLPLHGDYCIDDLLWLAQSTATIRGCAPIRILVLNVDILPTETTCMRV